MEAGLHVTVRGLVQGVGFRYFVLRKAAALGLSGYVRNSPDGSVEVMAEGEKALLEELLSALRIGPRSAAVRHLALEWMAPTHQFSDFEVR